MIGHAESWNSGTTKDILENLKEVMFTFLDEAHIPLAAHWDNFRPQLKLVPGQLRGKAVKNAPCLAMTATLAPSEVPELESTLGFRSKAILLRDNPIQPHHKYIRKVTMLILFILFLSNLPTKVLTAFCSAILLIYFG